MTGTSPRLSGSPNAAAQVPHEARANWAYSRSSDASLPSSAEIGVKISAKGVEELMQIRTRTNRAEVLPDDL
jgi:hypothetical protein